MAPPLSGTFWPSPTAWHWAYTTYTNHTLPCTVHFRSCLWRTLGAHLKNPLGPCTCKTVLLRYAFFQARVFKILLHLLITFLACQGICTQKSSLVCGRHTDDVTSVGQQSVDLSRGITLENTRTCLIQKGLAALLKMVVRTARQVKNINKMPFPKYTKWEYSSLCNWDNSNNN